MWLFLENYKVYIISVAIFTIVVILPLHKFYIPVHMCYIFSHEHSLTIQFCYYFVFT